MHRNRSVDVHKFTMVPRAEIPRSTFDCQSTHKTTFDAGYLIPIYLDEVLPGDTHRLNMTAFARMATPIYPIMDNLYLDSFFFFVPCRLLWNNWVKFMGEQTDPGDSISYTIPTVTSKTNGYDALTVFDYFGLPCDGQISGGDAVTHNVLPLRAYNLIYNEWFRDENLQDSEPFSKADSGDLYTDYTLLRRGKRKDYFTSCLPWPQKGASVALPLGSTAPVYGTGKALGFTTGTSSFFGAQVSTGGSFSLSVASYNQNVGGAFTADSSANDKIVGVVPSGVSGLYADLSAATAATINQLRQSFQIQKLLERDARGGTRYTEIIRSHFGVISPDARLQRPEYLGGGSTPINISPIAQTTPSDGSTPPLGNLAAFGTGLAHNHGFTASFTEHGYIIGIVSVRADLTYQNGLHKMWDRSTRYDFYFPAFAMLGEQAVKNREIYVTGTAQDNIVFGYQERWAEYRYFPSRITGLFKSTCATPPPIDGWHLAQNFSGAPNLGYQFIEENPPMSRILAVGSSAGGQQFLFDSFFDCRKARPLPMYSVPGLIDHF